MRSLLAILISFSSIASNASDRDPDDLKYALSRDWSVVRVSHYHFMGDFDKEYPVLFFQLLPDNRILLSIGVQRRFGRPIPKPLRFIEADEWETIEGEIVEHYSTAYGSDPDAQIRKNGFGSDLNTIEVSVTGYNTKEFSHRFSLEDGSVKQFSEFLVRLTKQQRTEQAEALKP